MSQLEALFFSCLNTPGSVYRHTVHITLHIPCPNLDDSDRWGPVVSLGASAKSARTKSCDQKQRQKRQIYLRIYIYMYNCDFFFPSGTSLRARTSVPNVRWGGHDSTVGLTLPEVWARSVQCVAHDKPFKLCWPWEHLRQIPGFPQHPRGDWVSASLIPAYARKIWMQTRLFFSRRGYTCTRLFPSFCTEHHATILPPSSSPAP